MSLNVHIFYNASKRTKYRVEGKMLRGEGSKYVKDLFIQLFIITYVSSSARGFINFSTSAPGSRKTKLGYLWWFFQRSRNLFGDGFRPLKYFREKINQ